MSRTPVDQLIADLDALREWMLTNGVSVASAGDLSLSVDPSDFYEARAEEARRREEAANAEPRSIWEDPDLYPDGQVWALNKRDDGKE